MQFAVSQAELPAGTELRHAPDYVPVAGAKSVDRFCRDYDIGRTTFYTEVNAGRLKIVKLGRKTLVLAEDERSWLARLKGEAA